MKPHLQGRKDSESKKLQLTLDNIELDEMVRENAIFKYDDLVKRFYLIYYYVTHSNEVIKLDPRTDISGFSDPSNEYLKYILILHLSCLMVWTLKLDIHS